MSTWNYGGNPAGDTIDEVRHLCGDTVKIEISLTDQEIAYMIIRNGSGYPAAIAACYALAARATSLADEVTGELEVKWSQRARAFYKLAEALSGTASGKDGVKVGQALATGVSVSDMDTRASNTDRVPNKFAIGAFDNLEV